MGWCGSHCGLPTGSPFPRSFLGNRIFVQEANSPAPGGQWGLEGWPCPSDTPIPLVRDWLGILTATNQGRALAALRDCYWSHSELRFWNWRHQPKWRTPISWFRGKGMARFFFFPVYYPLVDMRRVEQKLSDLFLEGILNLMYITENTQRIACYLTVAFLFNQSSEMRHHTMVQ